MKDSTIKTVEAQQDSRRRRGVRSRSDRVTLKRNSLGAIKKPGRDLQSVSSLPLGFACRAITRVESIADAPVANLAKVSQIVFLGEQSTLVGVKTEE